MSPVRSIMQRILFTLLKLEIETNQIIVRTTTRTVVKSWRKHDKVGIL